MLWLPAFETAIMTTLPECERWDAVEVQDEDVQVELLDRVRQMPPPIAISILSQEASITIGGFSCFQIYIVLQKKLTVRMKEVVGS